MRIGHQEVADHAQRQGTQDHRCDAGFAGHRLELAAALFTLADQLDQVLHQLAGIAAVALVDAQPHGEQTQLVLVVKLGQFVDRIVQRHAQLYVAPYPGHGRAQGLARAVDTTKDRVIEGSPGLEAAHAVVQQSGQLFDKLVHAPST